MENSSKEINWQVKITIIFLSLIEAGILNLLYPILPFMVEHYLGENSSEQLISEYSGYLEGIYRLNQFIGCILAYFLFRGAFSDVFGRKKILILTTFANFISAAHLAFSTSYKEAFVNRFLSGLCAGSTPVTKSLMREISDDKTISKLYGVFAIGVGLANFIGPLLALFSNPAETVDILKDSGFFIKYPYFLPLFMHSIICFITLLMVTFFLQEPTKPVSKSQESFSSLFRNPQYLQTVLSYWILGFFQFGFRLLFSLICKTQDSLGGMGISYEYQVSLIQIISGLFVVFIPPILTPILSKKYGLRNSLTYISLSMIPICLNLSLSHSLPSYVKYGNLSITYGIENSLISIFIFYISICISNTVTSSVMATAIGFSQALIGISRFAGTSLVGLLYGWTVSDGIEFSLVDARLTCFVLTLAPLVNCWLIAFVIGISVEHKKEERDEAALLLEKK